MMNSLQQGIVTLIRSAITGEACQLPADFDMEQAYAEIVRHQIVPLAYEGAMRCGISRELSVMRKLFQGYLKCLVHSEQQMKAVERICAAFDEAEIDYMPLKGCNLKALYPKPEMRLMGDADILIRMDQYARIKPIVEGLGFTEQVESDHELIWYSNALHLELHKRLIPSYNRDYYRYFGDGWRLAKSVAGTRYGLSGEDEYIYLFTHFAKHYRDGGIGCRHVADLWVYRRANPQLDERYIASELKKLQLLEFYQNIERLLRVWFEEAESDLRSDFMADFIFQSGSWGKAENHVLSAGVKNARDAGSVERGRVQSILRLVFPSVDVLSKRYPVLKKAPILLPLFWPVRWVTALLFRRDTIRRQQSALKIATSDKIETYQQALNYVGLDFHFKE